MNELSHCVTAECHVPAVSAYAFLMDGAAIGRWALGCMNTIPVGGDVVRGTSLFDEATLFAKPVGDPATLTVEYHVGADPTKLVPRIMAKVIPGPMVGRSSETSLVSLMAWRDAGMSDERWRRLQATHEAEIWLVKMQMERHR